MRLPLLIAAFALAATPAFAAAQPPESLSFAVLRDGDAVGTHTLKFDSAADTLQVKIDTNVVVKVALIPVYRFEHHGSEVWHDGHLISLSSTTNDDGTHHSLSVSRSTAVLNVTGDGQPSTLPPDTLPASLWNVGTVARPDLLNTLDGRDMKVRITDLGDDTVNVHGRPTGAHHYAMVGDLSRELWYDATGTLVKVRFKAKDDSTIEYVLK